MLVNLEALLLDTESELDFLKISKFCKNLRFGQYFPYQILKLIGKLSGSSENGQIYDYTFLFTVTVVNEDGDLSFGLRVGVVNVFGCQIFLSAQIALKVSEIESRGSCGSILISRF